MKKAIVCILTIALVMSLGVLFVACDNDKAETASNAEVLGTTVAVMAQTLGAGTAAEASDDSAAVDFNAGINLSVGGDKDAVSFVGSIVTSNVVKAVEPVLQDYVNNVKNMLGENGISVGKVDNDDDNYDEKYAITITHIDEQTAESKTTRLALYIKLTTDGASVEGKTAYSFKAKVVLVSDNEHINGFSYEFGGNATFDNAKDAMLFTLGAAAGEQDSANAFAGITAYGTAKGSVVIDMGAGAGINESLGVSAGLTIEIGKLADGKYGATIAVAGSLDLSDINTRVDLVVTVNVYANSIESSDEFVVNGNIDASVAIPFVGEYKATASLDGKAVYDADKDEAVVGVSGTLSFARVESESK